LWTSPDGPFRFAIIVRRGRMLGAALLRSLMSFDEDTVRLTQCAAQCKIVAVRLTNSTNS